MSRSLGEAFVNIVPDSAGFGAKMQAQIRAQLKNLNATISPGVDAARFDAAVARMRASIADLEARSSGLKFTADTTALTAQILGLEKEAAALEKQLGHLTAAVDVRAAIAKLDAVDAQLAYLRAHGSIRLTANTTALDAELAAAKAELDRTMRNRQVVLSAKLDGTSASLLSRLTGGLLGGGGGGSTGGSSAGGLAGGTAGGGLAGAGGGLGGLAGNPYILAAGIAAGVAAAPAIATVIGSVLIGALGSGLAGLGIFGAMRSQLPASITTAQANYQGASAAAGIASKNPANAAAYGATLTGPFGAFTKLLTDQGVQWQNLTVKQQNGLTSLRDNKSAYRALLPDQQKALNALLKQRDAWNQLSPAQQTAARNTANMTAAQQNLTQAGSDFLVKVGAPMVPVLTDIFNTAGKVLTALGPGFVTAITAIAGPFQKFADALITAFGQPAVQKSIQDVAKAFAAMLTAVTPQLATDVAAIAGGISNVANAITKNPKVIAKFVKDMVDLGVAALDIVAWLIQAEGGIQRFGEWLGRFAVRVWKAWRNQWDQGMRDIENMWNSFFNNVIGRAIRGGHDVEHGFDVFRHDVAGIFDRVRHDLAAIWDAMVAVLVNIWNSFWNNTIGRAIRGWQDAVRIIGNVRHDIANTFDNLRHDIAAIWDNIWNDAKKLWDRFTSFFTTTVPNAFGSAVTAIGRVWNGLRDALAGPVRWVVNNIVDPLFGLIDKVTGFVGLGSPLPQIHMAAGGRVPGWGGGDRIPAILEAGEAVVPKRLVPMFAAAFGAAGIPGFAAGGLAGNPLTQALGWIKSGWGKLTGFGADLLKGLSGAAISALTGMIGHGTGGASGEFAALLADIPATIIKDAVGFLQHPVQKFSAKAGLAKFATSPFASGAPATGGTVLQEQQFAAKLGQQLYGWVPSYEMPSLISLWNMESGWDPNAVNAASGAAGIPQALGHGHVFNLGDWANQIRWGENYIHSTYGDPIAAWAFEMSHTPHWYAAGGLAGRLRGQEALEAREYAGLASASWSSLKHARKGSWLSGNRSLIMGELATLRKRQLAESAAYHGIATGHFSKASLSRFAAAARAEAGTALDKALVHAHPMDTRALASTLGGLNITAGMMAAAAGKGGKPPVDPLVAASARLLKYDLAAMAPTGLSGGFGYASGGVVNEPVYGFGARSGMPYSFAENGPETVVAGGGGLTPGERMLAAKLDKLIAVSRQQGAEFARGLNGTMTRGHMGGYYGGG